MMVEKMVSSLEAGGWFRLMGLRMLMLLMLLLTEIGIGFICHGVNGLLSKLIRSSATRVSTDFCNMEILNVTCGDDEVIVIDTARYGRMNVGRCVSGNYGYLGCAVDTHRLLEEKCSGRQHCRFQVPDKTMYEMRPCPVDFTSYLEVGYFCLPVAAANRTLCGGETHLQPLKLTESSAFISNTLSMERGDLGSKECPWQIEGQQGQTINVTLYNFGFSDRYDASVLEPATGQTRSSLEHHSHGRPGGGGGGGGGVGRTRPDVCFEVAVLTDRESKRTLTVCDSDAAAREPVVVVRSKWHQMRLEFTNRKLMRSLGGAFLIHYKMIGCPELRLADDMTSYYTSSEKSHLVVQCNSSSASWRLTCRGIQWDGKIGNCSNPMLSSAASGEDWNMKRIIIPSAEPFPYGLLLAISLGVTVGVILGGLLLCLVAVYVKRYTKTQSGGYMQPEEQYFCMNHPYNNVRTSSHCQCPLSRWLSAAQSTSYDPDLLLCPSCCATNVVGICADGSCSCSRHHVLTSGPGGDDDKMTMCCRQQQQQQQQQQQHLFHRTNPDHGSTCLPSHQPLNHATPDCCLLNEEGTGFSVEVVANSNCNHCCSCRSDGGALVCPGLDASQHTTIGRHISSDKTET